MPPKSAKLYHCSLSRQNVRTFFRPCWALYCRLCTVEGDKRGTFYTVNMFPSHCVLVSDNTRLNCTEYIGLYYNVLHYTVSYCTVSQDIILRCTVIYCSVLQGTVLNCSVLWGNVLYCNIVHCTAPYYTALYYTTQYYTLLY